MKRFKDILNEFRMNYDPPNHDDRGDRDPVDDVLDFMKTVPFEHKTADGHTLHFYDSHDAATRLLENREKHDRGWGYAMSKGRSLDSKVLGQRGHPDGNYFYFASSIGSHDSVIDELLMHIHNHPQLPAHLRDHVASAFERLDDTAQDRIESDQKGQSSDIGEITFRTHAHSSTGDHPHQDDASHHFQSIIRDMKDDPDIGYFLHKDEMA